MKNIVVVLLLIQSCFFYAQQEERPKPPKFSSSDRVGILYYEAEEVSETIKVKEDSDRFYDLAKALRKYNRKVKEVAFLNSNNFKELDVKINEMLNREGPVDTDPEVQKKEREELEELRNVIPEARKKIMSFEKELNENLKTVLKEKQYKKWLKYQKKQKRSLIPERPSNNNGNGRMNRSGFGRGMNSMQRGGNRMMMR